jgi:hypothetical protein
MLHVPEMSENCSITDEDVMLPEIMYSISLFLSFSLSLSHLSALSVSLSLSLSAFDARTHCSSCAQKSRIICRLYRNLSSEWTKVVMKHNIRYMACALMSGLIRGLR